MRRRRFLLQRGCARPDLSEDADATNGWCFLVFLSSHIVGGWGWGCAGCPPSPPSWISALRKREREGEGGRQPTPAKRPAFGRGRGERPSCFFLGWLLIGAGGRGRSPLPWCRGGLGWRRLSLHSGRRASCRWRLRCFSGVRWRLGRLELASFSVGSWRCLSLEEILSSFHFEKLERISLLLLS